MQIDSTDKKAEDKPMEAEQPIAYKPVLKIDGKTDLDMYKE